MVLFCSVFSEKQNDLLRAKFVSQYLYVGNYFIKCILSISNNILFLHSNKPEIRILFSLEKVLYLNKWLISNSISTTN